MRQKNSEVVVGLFLFLGIFLLGLFVLKAGDIHWFRQGYYIEFVFPNVSGLKIGSPVRLAGVDIGSVKEVRVVYDSDKKMSLVEVYAYVNKDVQFPIDSKVEIVSIGLLGDKGIEITPGIDYSRMVKPGDILYGIKETDLQDLIKEGEKIAEEIRKGLATFNEIIADEEIVETVKQSIAKFGKASEQMENTLKDLQDLFSAIKTEKGTLGRLIYDDTVYVLLELTAYDINSKLNQLLDDLRRHPWKLFIKTKDKKRIKD